MKARCERSIRNHDPCISCAAHFLKLQILHWRGFSSVIIVDAVAPITKPGQVHRLDLTNNPLPVTFALRSTHAFGLAETVELARGLGRLPLFVVAHLVEGEQFETGAPLSPAVAGAVEEAVERIMIELSEIREPLKRKEPPVMHEVALVRDVVRRIEDLARATSAHRVTGAKVLLGALSHLSAGHFREHFTIEARDTLAGGAVL